MEGDYTMNPYYNRDYEWGEVDKILSKIKACIEKESYYVSLNEKRKENISFINTYNIRKNKQKSILMQIEVDDFCYSLRNKKNGYENEVLYVFVPQVSLFNSDDDEECVSIYTKFNILDQPSGNFVVVISFHKLNRPIDYLFR